MSLHVDLDSKARGFGDQQARRADPALAEMKIIANGDTADAKPLDEIVVNEVLSCRAGPVLVESHDHGAVKPGPGQ
jgi:hypothetical protein